MENNLRELQLLVLDILIKITDFCEENQIIYYISGGTYLGAVRHKGFIPWDDDVDIAMPREDYERFIVLFPEVLKNEKIELITYKNPQDSFYYYPTKVVNDEIKMQYKGSKNEKTMFAWVDIFPLDGMPSNIIKSKFHQLNLLVKRALFKLSCFDDVVNIKDENRPVVEKILVWIGKNANFGKLFDPMKRLDAIDRTLKKYPADKSDFYVNFMGAYRFKSIFNKKVYGKGDFYDFEGFKLHGPEYYDEYLRQIYGEYMELPPEAQKNKHQTEILN